MLNSLFEWTFFRLILDNMQKNLTQVDSLILNDL